MKRIICLLQLAITSWSYPLHNPFEYIYPAAPYQYQTPYPDRNYGYNYGPQVHTYSSYLPTFNNEYIHDYAAGTRYSPHPEVQPTMNIMAELPYAVSNELSVVPMFIVSKNDMSMVSQGHITSISEEQPTMTIKAKGNESIPCTPAVRMVLDRPIVVGSLKSNILFPTEVQIVHEGVRIPIRIGAVIAPVLPQTYVSQESPISVRVVYAVPTKPIKITITIEPAEGDTNKDAPSSTTTERATEKPATVSIPEQERPTIPNVLSGGNQDRPFNENVPPAAEGFLHNQGPFGALSQKPDYVNNADALVVDQESVVVQSESELPPKNITVIDFPDQEAEPHLDVDEEDDELVNRNPPQVLAPAGIVQSTQPESHVEPFHNDKESPYLETLREDAKKKRL